MKDGLIKVAAATPEIRVADCAYNAQKILDLCREAQQQGVQVLGFPELCLTGSTCGDLFLHEVLLDGAKQQLLRIADETAEMDMLIFIGLPVRVGSTLYNAAAVLHKGTILGMIPKRTLSNFGTSAELRHFTAADDDTEEEMIWDQQEFWLDPNQLFQCDDLPAFTVGAELGDDLFGIHAPSGDAAQAGASIILNLSASNTLIGKAAYRRDTVRMQSGRALCGYVYCNAGKGESNTDLVFSGQRVIAENGELLAEAPLFTTGLTVSEIDVKRMDYERRRANTFVRDDLGFGVVPFAMELRETILTRSIAQSPFIPEDKDELAQRCEEILMMQSSALAGRIRHTHAKTAVVGLSGGLDSALALVVTVHAFDLLGRDRKDIISITMPCFGTTSRTKNNALTLAEAYGTSCREIAIGDSVKQHFLDIGHDIGDHTVTFENAQARERTQVLMDIANKSGGLVIGTGDLSELALGWATYNGDHMSMYGVNGSIPKTLVRHLTAYEAQREGGEAGRVLLDVLATPVSPELLPPKDGEISQKTEELVGPYELHDFYLYYFIRFGMEPRKIYRLAKHAFAGVYDDATIKKWLTTFVRRFFMQQFKRTCLPDGPKVGSVSLSPRGDWSMPSDAVSALWMEQCEDL